MKKLTCLLLSLALLSSSVIVKAEPTEYEDAATQILLIESPKDRLKALRSKLKSIKKPIERIKFMRAFISTKKYAREIKSSKNSSKKASDNSKKFYQDKERVFVDSVYDGDTFNIKLYGESEKIRLLGIETPEVKQGKKNSCLGVETRDYVESLIGQKEVIMIRDAKQKNRGSFGRLLRYVDHLGVDLGEDLLSKGYAQVYTKADFTKKEKYLDYEKEAQEKELGIWGDQCEQGQSTTTQSSSTKKSTDINLESFQCGTKLYCTQMNSCEEARYYLSSCGLERLDRDNDGVPCESLCGE